MPSRIILKFKNSAFPKTVRLPVGYRQDGSEATRPVQIRFDECVCKRCAGFGTVEVWDASPSSRSTLETCPACNGDLIVKVAA